jgi:hypothetical protein
VLSDDSSAPESTFSSLRDEIILNTSTGDKSLAYFLVVPPGHTSTATALNAEMSKLQGPSGRKKGAKHIPSADIERKPGGKELIRFNLFNRDSTQEAP